MKFREGQTVALVQGRAIGVVVDEKVDEHNRVWVSWEGTGATKVDVNNLVAVNIPISPK